jgi:nucleoside-diphosphate-sugar epimerase
MQHRNQTELPRSMPDLLVTGGSGFVGQRLVRTLASRGHSIVSMYHHRLPETHLQVFPVCSDMGSPELLAAPLRGISTVVHLAWEGGLAGPPEQTGWDFNQPERLSKNIRILQNLIAAMEKAGTKRIVFVSALGASRQSRVPFLMEKYLAEFLILNSKIKEKIILRSGVLSCAQERSDRFVRSISRLMTYPMVYPVPRLAETIAPLHVDDLVASLADCCFHDLGVSHGAIVEVTGQENYKLDELFRLVCDSVAGGGRLALKGFLGDSLLPLFEREKRNEPRMQPKLRHFLDIGKKPSPATQRDNPLADVIPESMHSFRKAITDGKPDLPSSV